MALMRAQSSTLLLVDFQTKLMPAIDQPDTQLANARRLIDAARLFGVPMVLTEQNPKGLGKTVAGLTPDPAAVVPKMTFNAHGRPGSLLLQKVQSWDVIVAGWEAHVCVLQTVLALINAGRQVFVVRDAVGSRHAESKNAALERMQANGAELVTTEMVVFEWLETAEHPRFRDAIALIK